MSPAPLKASSKNLFLNRGGEMGELMRSFNWSASILGPAEDWPLQLKQLTSILLNNPSQMLICWGPSLIQLYNDAFRPILRSGKHPLALGSPVHETYPEVWERLEPLFIRALQGEPVAFKDYKLPVNRNGYTENLYVDFSCSPITDENGNIHGVLVLCTETTDKFIVAKRLRAGLRKQLMMTEVIKRSEIKLRNIILQAPVAIAIFTGPTFIIDVYNDRVLEYWGRTSAEVKGKPLFTALPEASGQGFEELLTQVFQTGERFVASELPVKLLRNGVLGTTWINFIYDPLRDMHGVITGIMVVCHEVTEQVNARLQVKESEQNLQTLADNISQLTWIADEKGNVYWYNKRWFDYTGTTLEFMKSSDAQYVFHPDQVEHVSKSWFSHVASGEIYEYTLQLKSRSGLYRWFLTRAIPLKDDTGHIIRWFGTNTDITEQRDLAQQKDDFISIASHELKTPVTSLKASLQLLDGMKNNPSPLMPRLISQSTRIVDRLTDLIDDLLDASRLNQKQLHIAKNRFILAGMLESCCSHIRMAGMYELIITGDKGLEVFADEHRIEQVIVNFVNNAVKYAPESKIIYLGVEKHQGFAKLTVRDTGKGIDPEKIPHLFAKYYQAEHRGHQYSGLGLGLYISAEIIKRHGGEIGVDNEPGKGSTFWFSLPL